MPATVVSGPQQSQGPKTQLSSPTWIAWPQVVIRHMLPLSEHISGKVGLETPDMGYDLHKEEVP